jgi:hypothetical protein
MIVADPLPDAVVTDIHDTLAVAVHAHPDCVVSVNCPWPPVATTFSDVGEIEYVHGAGAAAS